MMRSKPGTSKDDEPTGPSVYYNLDEIEDITRKNILISKALKSRETSQEKLAKILERPVDSDSESDDSNQDEQEQTSNRLSYLNMLHKVGRTLMEGGNDPLQLDRSGRYFRSSSTLEEWKAMDDGGVLIKTGFLAPYREKKKPAGFSALDEPGTSKNGNCDKNEEAMTCTACNQTFEKIKAFVKHMKICRILKGSLNQNKETGSDNELIVDVTSDEPLVQLEVPPVTPAQTPAEKLLPFLNATQRLQLLHVPPLERHAYHEHYRGHVTPNGDSVPVKVKPLVVRLRADFEKLMRKLKMKSLTCVVCKTPSPPSRWVVTSLTYHALHKRTHTNSFILECQFCSFTTKKVVSFYRHTLLHTKEDIYSCYNCPFRTQNYSQLNYHKLQHYELQAYQCSKCSFRAYDYRSLKKHYANHLTLKNFRCSACPKKFLLLKHLLQHMDSHVAQICLWSRSTLKLKKTIPVKVHTKRA